MMLWGSVLTVCCLGWYTVEPLNFGPAILSSVARLSSSQWLKVNYCYGKGFQNGVLCWKVVPFSEGPQSDFPLYSITSCTGADLLPPMNHHFYTHTEAKVMLHHAVSVQVQAGAGGPRQKTDLGGQAQEHPRGHSQRHLQHKLSDLRDHHGRVLCREWQSAYQRHYHEVFLLKSYIKKNFHSPLHDGSVNFC